MPPNEAPRMTSRRPRGEVGEIGERRPGLGAERRAVQEASAAPVRPEESAGGRGSERRGRNAALSAA